LTGVWNCRQKAEKISSYGVSYAYLILFPEQFRNVKERGNLAKLIYTGTAVAKKGFFNYYSRTHGMVSVFW